MGSAINDQMGRHQHPFHRAARIGDLAALERLLTDGADVNTRSDLATDHGSFLRGLTPLMLAAASNEGASVETLRWLLDHGADLRAESAGGVTAAWYAASGIPWWVQEPQSDAGHAERLRYLLDAGLSPHETSFNGRSLLGESARAGDPASVLLLLDRGVPPGPASTAEDSAQERAADGSLGVQPAHRRQDAPLSFVIPLFGAAESGSAQCVDLLLRRGSDPNVRDRGGSTPLMVAATPDVVERLVAGGADVNTTDASGDDVLGAFLRHSQDDPNPRLRRLDVARALLAAGAPLMRLGPFGSSRLNAAAFRLDGDAVEILLSLGVVPSPDSRGHQTPLHAVCWQNSYDQPERSAMIDRIVRALAVAGNPLEARDEECRTPLHEACGGDGGNAAAVAALLDLGADPEATDADDTTPLLVASWNGEVSCIQHLLAAGADPMRRGRDGKTALDAVRGHRDTWRELVAEAADDQVESYRTKLAEAEGALRLVESAVASRGR